VSALSAPATTASASRATIFEVEREARWRIWLLFGLLLLVVFVVAYVPIAAVTVTVASLEATGDMRLGDAVGRAVVYAGLAALALSVGAWLWAGANVRGRLVGALHARPLDAGDAYHQRLARVVEELCLAAGRPRIDCMIVPCAGMNAFAFSDLRGGGCLGVTEGLLGRLSRQQLETVVAHEMAHLASRDCVTATRACMLFAAATALDDAVDPGGRPGSGAMTDGDLPPNDLVLVPLQVMLWFFELCAAVVNAAISRQREFAADLAAAKYTRDPESLAEALRIIGRHGGGGGAIPFGLSPLCIRPTRAVARGTVAALLATHPPLEERIVRLRSYAGQAVDAASMAAGIEAPEFRGREHVERPPRSAANGMAETASAPGVGVDPAWRCPVCHAPLQRADYEGTEILVCRRCGGRLVTGWQVDRILARRSMGSTEGQRRLAALIAEDMGRWAQPQGVRAAEAPVSGVPVTACPQCGKEMARHVWSYAYPVEVDHCEHCEWRWFDGDELEVLQILVEREAG